jgi:type I restriction enzyme S subunit
MSEGYRKLTIDDVVHEIYDAPHATPEKTEEGPIFLGVSNLKNGRLDLSDTDHVSEEGFEKRTSRVTPHEGDIVFSYETRLGEAALIPDDLRCCLGRRMGLLRVDREVADPRYLLYAWLSPEFQRTIHAQASQGSTVNRILLTELGDYPIRVPPLPVQRRIADILGALDDKIELNRRMNETLEAMAQTLYYRLFDGAVKTGEIGLEELVEIKPRMPVPDDDEVLTYVGMADVEPHRMSVTDYGEKEYTSGRRFVNGDTLMARITPSLENGKTAFVDFLDEGEMAFGSTEFTVMRAREDTSPYFVYCCARDERFRDYAISTMTGSSGRQRVQENLLGEYTFEDLDHEAMVQFHEQAEPLFKQIRTNTSENRTLAETRDYLLPKLISGEVEVEEGQEVVDVAT